MNNRKFVSMCVTLISLLGQVPLAVAANETVAAASPILGVFKTLLGLLVVLAVMAGVAWIAKRMVRQSASSHAVVKIVGGVSVGNRERLVVVEVGNRWLVVGVAAGQVSAIANLSQEDWLSQDTTDSEPSADNSSALSFASRLKQSLLTPQQ